jgi:hypothetical protein
MPGPMIRGGPMMRMGNNGFYGPPLAFRLTKTQGIVVGVVVAVAVVAAIIGAIVHSTMSASSISVNLASTRTLQAERKALEQAKKQSATTRLTKLNERRRNRGRVGKLSYLKTNNIFKTSTAPYSRLR